jgi:hypothetical protein
MKTSARRLVIGGLLTAQLATDLLVMLVSGRLTSDAEADHTVALL